VQTNSLGVYSFISTANAIDASTEIFSTATLNQQAFISSVNVNSFQRYTSTSLTDPRVTNTGAAHLYNSMNTIGTFNVRANISTMGNFNVAGNVSSKLGTIYVGGEKVKTADVHPGGSALVFEETFAFAAWSLAPVRIALKRPSKGMLLTRTSSVLLGAVHFGAGVAAARRVADGGRGSSCERSEVAVALFGNENSSR
jgi:hypothetical protein